MFQIFFRLAIIVAAERLLAVKKPLHAKLYFTRGRITIAIITIYAMSFALNFFGFIRFTVVIKEYCNNTKFTYQYIPMNETILPNLHKYIQISLILAPFLIVCIPLVVLITLNSSLLYYLRQNRKHIAVGCSAIKLQQSRNNEQKITFTVFMIIFSIVIFYTPAAILYLYDWMKKYVFQYTETESLQNAWEISNLLIYFSNATNFAFYSTNKKWRQCVLELICSKRQKQFHQVGKENNRRVKGVIFTVERDKRN